MLKCYDKNMHNFFQGLHLQDNCKENERAIPPEVSTVLVKRYNLLHPLYNQQVAARCSFSRSKRGCLLVQQAHRLHHTDLRIDWLKADKRAAFLQFE